MIKRFIFISIFFLSSLSGELFDPVALYLTWQHEPDSTMTIQWLTPLEQTEDLLEYRSKDSQEWKKAISTHTSLPYNFPYFLHRIELTGLASNSDYLFRIGSQGVIHKFRTMPSTLDQPISFVAGGDLYHDDLTTLENMHHQAALQSPYFALVGGDIAYSAGKYAFLQKLHLRKEKTERWLEWLISWKKKMVTPEGYTIPLITAIGNHEVIGGFEETPAQALFYYALFPTPNNQGYRTVDFGNYMSLFILDSDHSHPVGNAQKSWLNISMEKRDAVPHKFALYHVGAYPSVRKYNDPLNRKIRQEWVPIFDKYHLDAAFENHDHAYKRTHPLRNGQYHPEGVLYIGDGAWGIAEPRAPKTPEKCWYLAYSAQKQNVTVVTVYPDKNHYKAIDAKGSVIDEYSQKVGRMNENNYAPQQYSQ